MGCILKPSRASFHIGMRGRTAAFRPALDDPPGSSIGRLRRCPGRKPRNRSMCVSISAKSVSLSPSAMSLRNLRWCGPIILASFSSRISWPNTIRTCRASASHSVSTIALPEARQISRWKFRSARLTSIQASRSAARSIVVMMSSSRASRSGSTPIVFGRFAHGDPLQRDARLADLVDALLVEDGNEGAAIGRACDDPLRLQNLQRLAERHAAHREAFWRGRPRLAAGQASALPRRCRSTIVSAACSARLGGALKREHGRGSRVHQTLRRFGSIGSESNHSLPVAPAS